MEYECTKIENTHDHSFENQVKFLPGNKMEW